MGKSTFIDITDGAGKIQLYSNRSELGEENYTLLKKLDVGDIIGASGKLFRTRTGEPTLRISEFTIQIVVASLVAFIVSETFDAWIYDKLRELVSIKSDKWWKYLWVRNVFSDIISLGIDSVIFVTIAFFNSGFNLVDIIVGQLILKWFLGVIDTPFMYLTRWIYNQYETIKN